MFVLLFGFEDVFSRNSFDRYYMPLIETIFYYSYHQNYYELIGIDLSRQTNTSILQQIYFVRKYCENIFYDWKAAGISLDLLNVTG